MTETEVRACSTTGCESAAVAYWYDAGPFGAGTFYGCGEHAPDDATPIARAEQTARNCGPGGAAEEAAQVIYDLRRQVTAVRDLHVQFHDDYLHQDVCAHCSDGDDGRWALWPCPTIKVLEAAGGSNGTS